MPAKFCFLTSNACAACCLAKKPASVSPGAFVKPLALVVTTGTSCKAKACSDNFLPISSTKGAGLFIISFC
jgi:hypothetical protein